MRQIQIKFHKPSDSPCLVCLLVLEDVRPGVFFWELLSPSSNVNFCEAFFLPFGLGGGGGGGGVSSTTTV